MDRRILVFLGTGLVVLIVLFLFHSPAKKEWGYAQRRNTAEAYESFIGKYPKSEFVPAAQKQIFEMLETAKEYQAFTEQYPDSEFAPEAQARAYGIQYEAYRQRDSVKACAEFLEKYPDSPFRKQVLEKMKEIVRNRAPELQEVQTASVEIVTRFPAGTKLEFLEDIRSVVETILQYAGFQVVDGEDGKRDAFPDHVLFRLWIRGKALGQSYTYSTGESSYSYTGAEIAGSVALKIAGRNIVKKRFSEVAKPDRMIFNTTWGDEKFDPAFRSEKKDAPFESIWHEIGFKEFVYGLLEEQFGKETLIDAMPDIVANTPDYALVDHLGQARPISRLAALYECCGERARQIAIRAVTKQGSEVHIMVLRALHSSVPDRSSQDLEAAPLDLPPGQTEQERGLQRRIKQDPQDTDALKKLANYYYDRLDYEKAVTYYESFIVLDPGNPDVWTDLGAMYFHMDQADSALSAFDRAIQLQPDHKAARLNKGLLLIEVFEDPAGGLKVWEELLEMDPDIRIGSVALKERVNQLREEVKKNE